MEKVRATSEEINHVPKAIKKIDKKIITLFSLENET